MHSFSHLTTVAVVQVQSEPVPNPSHPPPDSSSSPNSTSVKGSDLLYVLHSFALELKVILATEPFHGPTHIVHQVRVTSHSC
mmetsp:Transcript_24509/g.44323  ORF Transcript_24509/g.44323 Transcript_24509/m.44323 type:complete len:82 (+) Transcript_24509:247-492(+)